MNITTHAFSIRRVWYKYYFTHAYLYYVLCNKQYAIQTYVYEKLKKDNHIFGNLSTIFCFFFFFNMRTARVVYWQENKSLICTS